MIDINIETIISYLNRKYNTTLDTKYYANIELWNLWYKGFYAPFHRYSERSSDGNPIKRDLYTYRAAKMVCEDWASILLNERTDIRVSDANTEVFLKGKQGDNEDGGFFEKTNFWLNANELCEKAFALGTGAAVVKFDGFASTNGSLSPDPKADIWIDYISAGAIIPLTVRRKKIIDVAFVSQSVEKGKPYIYLETHVLEPSGYVIENKYFSVEQGSLVEAPLPPNVLEKIETKSTVPLFAILKPNLVNNVDEKTVLGMSIYANALDNLKGVDLAFNNFCRDLWLGGKKVFVNQQLVRRDDHGRVYAPDDVAQQLFMYTSGDDFGNAEAMYHEHNPDLRISDNQNAMQAQLDYLSQKVGFGTKHYQFNSGSIVTATQYMGDKQDLVQHASKHMILIQQFLKSIIRAILWAALTVQGANVDPETEIGIEFEDGFIINKDAEREQDRQDVRDGVMMDWEYRVKWYGETETEAKAILSEKKTDDEWMGLSDA